MTFRLHSRLVLWNVLIIGLISSILGYFVHVSIRNDFERQIENMLMNQSALAAEYLRREDGSGLGNPQAEKLSELLEVRVTLIAQDGQVLGDSDVDDAELAGLDNHRSRPEVILAMRDGIGTAVRRSQTVRVEYIYVARRLDGYVLRLAMPLSAVDSLVADLRSHLIFAMLLATAVTLVFGYVVRGLISRPLREIAAASKKLADGDLRQRLPITGDEEIATLGVSLNTMAENLSSTIQELSDRKQRLELILGAMGQGVMVVDSSGRISLTNNSIRGVVDSDRDPTGRTILEVFRTPDLDNAIREVLSGAASKRLEITTRNGRVFQTNIAPVTNIFGTVDSAVAVFTDFTDIHRTEKMRRDFVANVSHEFRTPLTSIRGYAETLLATASDDREVRKEFLEIIQQNAGYLQSLVSDLLTLAQLEAEPAPSKESVDVGRVIQEQLLKRKASIEEHGIRVMVDCPPIQLLAHRSRLSTAVSNLIDNAIYYNRRGGEIRISGELRAGRFALSIADTGEGIPSHELHRIFERFYRVDKARSRHSGGTGLGLSIVRHAIESQGGTIDVASKPGAGSTFTIHLPAG